MILLALGTGIILSFGFGSVFFALLQTSIDHGYTKGIKMASGVFFSDIIMVFIVLFGSSYLPDWSAYANYFKIIAAFFLVLLGVSQFLEVNLSKKVSSGKKSNFFYFFTKGAFLNAINPMNFITWLVLTASLISYHWSYPKQLWFFSICLITIFISECLIAFYATKISLFLNVNSLKWIKRSTGLIFIGLAIKLLLDVY